MNKPLILFVDDDVHVLESLKAGLEEKGYAMMTVQTGKEALDVLRSHTPSLMLIDLRMQPMSGFELYQEIKKNMKFANTPVFFLTAVDDFIAQKYSQKLGVNAYITKPVDIDDLHARIQHAIAGK
jgi:two-component system sensor histidine kinase ChiS